MSPKFAYRKEAAHATVVRSVPAPYQQKHKKYRVPASSKYFTVNLRVPDEYALALMEMYETDTVGKALMKHIRETVEPKGEEWNKS